MQQKSVVRYIEVRFGLREHKIARQEYLLTRKHAQGNILILVQQRWASSQVEEFRDLSVEDEPVDHDHGLYCSYSIHTHRLDNSQAICPILDIYKISDKITLKPR